MEHVITIRGTQYKIGEMDTFAQMHIARKVTPIMVAAIIPLGAKFFELMVADDLQRKSMMLKEIARLLPGAAESLATMSNEDAEFITRACMKVCQENINGQWARIALDNGQMMRVDFPLGVMMRLTVETVKARLGDFFETLGIETPTVPDSVSGSVA